MYGFISPVVRSRRRCALTSVAHRGMPGSSLAVPRQIGQRGTSCVDSRFRTPRRRSSATHSSQHTYPPHPSFTLLRTMLHNTTGVQCTDPEQRHNRAFVADPLRPSTTRNASYTPEEDSCAALKSLEGRQPCESTRPSCTFCSLLLEFTLRAERSAACNPEPSQPQEGPHRPW